MASGFESSIIRVYGSNRVTVVGGGVLVKSQYIFTCAHVINSALGRSQNELDQPTGEVWVDLPLVAPKTLIKAKVVRWYPVQAGEALEDIAGLELVDDLPNQAKPVPLIETRGLDLWSHSFRGFGFPAGKAEGVNLSGVVRSRLASGLLQVEDTKTEGYRFESGFSGTPIWDEQLQGIIGIAVSIDPRRPETKAAFIIPVDLLFQAWPALVSQVLPHSPYRGLETFQEEDADFFFGRHHAIERLVAKVDRHPLVAVLGSSGSGKSSVVYSGLIPKLKMRGWSSISFRPVSSPFRQLIIQCVSEIEEVENINFTKIVDNYAQKLETGQFKLADVFHLIIKKINSRLFVYIDQFEEIYTSTLDENLRQCFLDQLLDAVDQVPKLKVVLSMRADFLNIALSHYRFSMALQESDVKLGAMGTEELREVIEEPAKKCSVFLEPGLSERLINAVDQEPGSLPLLEFTLKQLWQRVERSQMTHAAYEAIGGVEKAIARHAQETYELLQPQDKQVIAKRIFLELVQVSHDAEPTRRQVFKSDLALLDSSSSRVNEVLVHLVEQKLVITSSVAYTNQALSSTVSADEATVDLVHEALIQHWPQLREWIDESRERLQIKRRIELAAYEWKYKELESPDDYLLQGTRLENAETYLELSDNLLPLSPLARDFIVSSQALRQRIQQQEAEQLQKELQQEQKARRAAQRTAIAALVAFISLIGAGGFTWIQQQQTLKLMEDITINSDRKPLEILDLLQRFLEVADNSRRSGDTTRALAYYQKIMSESISLHRQIKENPKNLESVTEKKNIALQNRAEQSIAGIIQDKRLPTLVELLKSKKIGKLRRPITASNRQNRYEPGALRETYSILMNQDGAGADANQNGLIDNNEEASRLPCQLLREIDQRWKQFSNGKCTWYSEKSFYYAPGCDELENETLTQQVLMGVSESAELRIKQCSLAPKDSSSYQ